MASPDNVLWDFAASLYSHPDVAKTCLELQDEYGANINVLLFSEWLQSQNILLINERLTAALASIQKWDTEYVQVLRDLRRTMKVEVAQSEIVSNVRNHIKTAELLAEKYELQCLQELSQQWQQRGGNDAKTIDNLTFYLSYLKIPDEKIKFVRDIFNLRR